MTKKQTPITLENIDKLLDKLIPRLEISLIPKIEKSLLPKVEKIVDVKLASFKYDINERFDNLDKKISHLPIKEEYFAREDKTMGELKKLRDEVAATGSLYEKTNKRVDKIDKHLRIDTSTVF